MACAAPQDSFPCIKQAPETAGHARRLQPDDRGLSRRSTPTTRVTRGASSKYADGCDTNLLGAPGTPGLDIVENQAILTTQNGSQAPIKDLLENIYDYFTNPAFDGFKNGVRSDDPNAACRNDAVILIYDNFNGCQNDNCGFLTSKILTPFKTDRHPGLRHRLRRERRGHGEHRRLHRAQHRRDPARRHRRLLPGHDAAGLYQALNDIAASSSRERRISSASTVSTAQAAGDQMVYLATFNAASDARSGTAGSTATSSTRTASSSSGTGRSRTRTTRSSACHLTAPSNDPDLLDLERGPEPRPDAGNRCDGSSAVLAPNARRPTAPIRRLERHVSTIATTRYPGRKIVFSLPQGYADPVTTLPDPSGRGAGGPARHDLLDGRHLVAGPEGAARAPGGAPGGPRRARRHRREGLPSVHLGGPGRGHGRRERDAEIHAANSSSG